MNKLIYFFCFLSSFYVSAQNDSSFWNNVYAGYTASFGIKSDGSLWAWGTGPVGLGDSSDRYNLPVKVGAGKWSIIAAGSSHTLGIKKDSTLWGWGENNYGSIGDSTLIERTSPVPIGKARWTAIAAVGQHSIGIQADSSLWGWGFNKYGSVGDSSTLNKTFPVAILPGTKWLQVSAGMYHSVGLRSDSTLWQWGFADWELRQNAFFIKSPVQIGTEKWMHIEAGGYHTLLLKKDSTLWGWGSNISGAMGNGTTLVVYRPAQISNDKWIDAAAGLHFSAGVKKDGSLWAWGDNHYGMLGDLTRANISTPVKIDGVNWKSVSGGLMYSLVLKADQPGFCATGDNGYGQLGTGKFGSTLQYICQLPPLTVTGIDNTSVESDLFSIFPNPSNGDITLRSPIPGMYTLINNLGQTVENFELKDEATNFQIKNLPNGIYFVLDHVQMHPMRKKLVVIR